MAKSLKYRLWTLAIIVFIAAWQAYAGFDRFWGQTTQEMDSRSNLLWFLSGPISFFIASALGLLFAFVAVNTKHSTGRKFWSSLLYALTAWLAVGGLVFLLLDWFRESLHFSPIEHIWHFVIIPFPMALAAYLLGVTAHGARNAPAILTAESSVTSKRLLASGARVVAWIALAAGSLGVVLASALLLLMLSCTPPSLESLSRQFPSKRSDLELIIRMSDQDSGLAVIDPSWLQLRDGSQFTTFDARAGITEARWDDYRQIFRRDDITQGIRRYQKNGDAFIIVKSEGLLDNGYSNGFLYCGMGPEHSYRPCSSKEERGNHPYTQGDEAYSFIRLSDRWYAFSEGPG